MSEKINSIMHLQGAGDVAELAYARDLKSLALGLVGSSPTVPTFFAFSGAKSRWLWYYYHVSGEQQTPNI